MNVTRTLPVVRREKRRVACVFAVALVGSSFVGACASSSVMNLDVGTCIQLPTESRAVTVDVRSCTESHNAEVSQVIRAANGEFPGDAALNQQAEKECIDTFENYVGTPYVTSALDVTWLIPTAESWTQRDRSIVCLVHAMDRSALTRSVRDSGL